MIASQMAVNFMRIDIRLIRKILTHSSLCCNHCAENPPLVVCFTNAIPARFAFQEVIFSSQITRFFKLSRKGVRHSNPARKIGDRSHSVNPHSLALREFCLPPVHGRNNTDIFTYNITLFLPIFFFLFSYFATGGRQLSDDYGDDTMTIATTTRVRFTPSIATRFSCARCVCLCYCLPTEKTEASLHSRRTSSSRSSTLPCAGRTHAHQHTPRVARYI